MLTIAHLIHRGGMIMRERDCYYNTRMRALHQNRVDAPRILSVIIDQEDSSKTKLPYVGRQCDFNPQLDTKITGAKVRCCTCHFK